VKTTTKSRKKNYLFPPFQKSHTLVFDLVEVLLQQHQAGRRITDQITQLTKTPTLLKRNAANLYSYSRLSYNVSSTEARERHRTFPAFRKIVSRHEYDSLGGGI